MGQLLRAEVWLLLWRCRVHFSPALNRKCEDHAWVAAEILTSDFFRYLALSHVDLLEQNIGRIGIWKAAPRGRQNSFHFSFLFAFWDEMISSPQLEDKWSSDLIRKSVEQAMPIWFQSLSLHLATFHPLPPSSYCYPSTVQVEKLASSFCKFWLTSLIVLSLFFFFRALYSFIHVKKKWEENRENRVASLFHCSTVLVSRLLLSFSLSFVVRCRRCCCFCCCC